MAEVEEQPKISDTEEKKTIEDSEKANDSLEKKSDDSLEKKSNDSSEKKTTNNDVEESHKDNSCDDISKLEADIIRQIEYYFGDANLLKDKFLLEQIKNDSDGWVPFSVLLTFKRLAALTKDVDVIITALSKSDEGLIEISDDKTKIRRHPERPIPQFNDELRKDISSRSAYAKGFPLTYEISDLIEYFKPFEKVENIILRKYMDKPTKTYKFKGSVFVTFATKDQCEEFIKKKQVECQGRSLIRKWKEDYLEEKRKEREQKNAKKKKEKEIELPKGSVVNFEVIGDASDLKRYIIKKAFNDKDIQVAFIKYTEGEDNGSIRFAEKDSAKPIIEKLDDSKFKINDDVELKLRLLTEDEEKEFLEKAVENIKSSMKNNPKGNKHKRNNKRKAADRGDNEPREKRRAAKDNE